MISRGATIATVAVMCLASAGTPASSEEEAGRSFTPAARVAYSAVNEVVETHGGSDASVELFLTDVYGLTPANLRQITETEQADVIDRVWSPDGTRMLVSSASRSAPDSGLSVVDAFGNHMASASDGLVDSADWSPDGARIVASHEDRVWTAADDGTDRREVFTIPPIDISTGSAAIASSTVTWLPTGDAVGVSASGWDGETPVMSHWILDLGAGTSQELERPSWPRSPDGMSFAYGEDGDIVIASAEEPGREKARITDPGGRLSSPVWSPDGRQVAYRRSSEDDPHDVDVGVARSDGSAARVFSAPPGTVTEVGPWAPDGSMLAATGFSRHEDRHREFLVFLDPASGTVDVRLQADGVDSLQWLPDSSAIAVTLVQPERGDGVNRFDVALVPVDGSVQFLPNPSEDVRPSRPMALTPTVAPTGLGRTVRAMGADRIATALEISRTTFSSADSVVIARADAYPDALAGAPLAHSLAAPLLLTASEQLDARVAAEVHRLGASHAVVLGTNEVMSDRVLEGLRELGVDDVDRVGGPDRHGTASMVADRLDTTDVFVVEGAHADPNRGWPDAVAVSGLAAATGRPILLTTRDRLPDATRAWLSEHRPDTVTVIGSHVAVSDAVATQIAEHAGTVARIGGVDRYDTSRLIANEAVEAGLDPATTFVVTGAAWPDALAAGVAAAEHDASLLLTSPTRSRQVATTDWLWSHRDEVTQAVLVGGLVALPATVQRELATILP